MTKRIDHAEGARNLQAHGYSESAQVHATLALVEQQRIANLIALHRHEVEYDLNGGRSLLYKNGTEELRPEIREALGID